MKRIIKPFLLMLVLIPWSGSSVIAQTYQSDDIVGTWLNEEGTGGTE